MAIKVQFEIGHTATVKTKRTPEGFTHDWELYVQGVNKADISAFVDKVVFNLHESFPKPKRSIKEPPYVIKESGYAGFELNIDIYFRNRDEPKRVTYPYDLHLQHEGPPIHRFEIKKFIFETPSEDFRQKLIKGSGIPISNVVGGAISSDDKSLDMNVSDGRSQMVSKPKLSTDGTSSTSTSSSKKHKQRPDDSKLNTFANLFGTPITKSASKFSPDPKAKTSNGGAIASTGPSIPGKGKDKSGMANSGSMSGSATSGPVAGSGKDKEKTDKKEKHKQLSSPHKEKLNEEKESKKKSDGKHDKREEKKKDKKDKDKERERNKDKSSKRSLSPKSATALAPSPKRPSPVRSSSTTSREETTAKSLNKTSETEKRGSSSSSGKKSKKEKKSHDKERDNKEKHRNDVKEANNTVTNVPATIAATTVPAIPVAASSAQFSKSSNISVNLKTDLNSNKSLKTCEKDKDLKKSDLKSEKESTPIQSSDKKSSTDKDKKSHKHKKKDKNKDREKEKDKDKGKDQTSKKSTSSKDKKEKRDKSNKNESTSATTTTSNSSSSGKKSADVDVPTETGSTKSTSSSVSGSSSTTKTGLSINKQSNTVANLGLSSSNNNIIISTGTATSASGLSNVPNDLSDVDSLNSENLHTISNSNSDKIAVAHNSDSSNSSFPELPPVSSKGTSVFQAPANPQPTPPTTPLTNASSVPVVELSRPQSILSGEKKTHKSGAEKLKADKTAEKEDKKRRRNSTAVNTFVEPPMKQIKKDVKTNREKSQSPLLRTDEKQTFLPPPATTSTLPVQNTPVSALNLEYLSELQELHQKIMTLQDNEELQQVVEMIAATGRYEITSKTFDFDLCKLDRLTVQRLQDFFATSVS